MDEAEQLMANPGKWGKLVTFTSDDDRKARQRASNLTSGINRKELKAFRTSGHWETEKNILGGGQVEVWVRWIKTDDPAPRKQVVPRQKPRKKPRKKPS
jgi:hypothetical protein